jgi:hypothetical protein
VIRGQRIDEFGELGAMPARRNEPDVFAEGTETMPPDQPLEPRRDQRALALGKMDAATRLREQANLFEVNDG